MLYRAAGPPPPASDQVVHLSINGYRAAATLTEPLLGFAIDTSQVVGGRWWSREGKVEVGRGAERTTPFDFHRPQLRMLARALAPARLRIGGTEADHVFYSEASLPSDELPRGYEYAFTAEHWNAVAQFANAVGYSLMMTVNAGPGPRDARGTWQTDNLQQLLRFAQRQPVADVVWELGNEVNAYWFIHGLSHRISAEQYAADFRRFAGAVHQAFPSARLAGPAGFLWPTMGEPLAGSLGIFKGFLSAAGPAADIVTWHYYPQQSRRCPMATRRAKLGTLLNPHALDETERWAEYVEELVGRYAPESEIWLGESGNAQCGGEPGVSDRFASSLWYLDQIGAMAQRGQPMIRQTLIGSHYGMLEPTSLAPRPDYWAAALLRKYVGGRMLRLERSGDNPYLRAYAACTPASLGQAPGAVALWLINLHPGRRARVVLRDAALREWHRVTASQLDGTEVQLDGAALHLVGGRLPAIFGKDGANPDREGAFPAGLDAAAATGLVASGGSGEAQVLELAPTSYAFAVVEGGAPACL